MKFKISYGLVVIFSLISLFGFSKIRKKEKIDKAVYMYECIYEVKTKADTFKYSITYDDSEDSILTINTSFHRYGEPMSGYLINCQFIRNKKIIDSIFITRENLKLNYEFTKFSIRDYRQSEKYFSIPLDSLKLNKHTFITIDGYDEPATTTAYFYRCKNQHTNDELKEIHKLSYPLLYTKNYNLMQAAIIYRDTCDCKLESRVYKEF